MENWLVQKDQWKILMCRQHCRFHLVTGITRHWEQTTIQPRLVLDVGLIGAQGLSDAVTLPHGWYNMHRIRQTGSSFVQLIVFSLQYSFYSQTARSAAPTPPPLTEGSISSAFQTPQTTRQLNHKVRHLQRSLTKKRQLSSSPVSHLQHLEKSAQTAMNLNLLLHQCHSSARAVVENNSKYYSHVQSR